MEELPELTEEYIKETDKSNIMEHLKNYDLQIRDAGKLGHLKIDLSVNKIVVAGMGESAIPGELLQNYIDDSFPVLTHKDYGLPRYVDNKTLLFCISYSGNTEETISAFDEARARGCKIIVITSGGKLLEEAVKYGIEHISIPQDIPPRYALGYLFIPMLNTLALSGIIPDQSDHIAKTVEFLQKHDFERSARILAEKLYNKKPLIYSSSKLAAIAYKWKTAFNKSTKIQAFSHVFPEMNHNELQGFETPNAFHAVFLIDEEDITKIKRRMAICKDIMQKRETQVTEIKISGQSKLARLVSAIAIGDWTTFYLALYYEKDPLPTPVIEDLKRQLRR